MCASAMFKHLIWTRIYYGNNRSIKIINNEKKPRVFKMVRTQIYNSFSWPNAKIGGGGLKGGFNYFKNYIFSYSILLFIVNKHCLIHVKA